MSEVHVSNTARALCEELKRDGFNKIRFHRAKVEDDLKLEDVWDSETQSGELNPKQFEEWRRCYACVITEPDFPVLDDCDSEYVECSFDEDRFYYDLRRKIEKLMGEDVQVAFRAGCFEWECFRRTYKHPDSTQPAENEARP